MRSFLLAVLFAGACAHSTGPRPINVAAVRQDISAQIRAENGDRTIQSMGRVRETEAVVFTTSASGEKLEETWVKTDGVWKLQTKTALK